MWSGIPRLDDIALGMRIARKVAGNWKPDRMQTHQRLSILSYSGSPIIARANSLICLNAVD
jgi:hypothetical protein